MRWTIRAGLAVFLACTGTATGQPAGQPDKAVTYSFDLTRKGEAKPTILTLALPVGFFQHSDCPPAWAPGTSVRKGWGTAWFFVMDTTSSICQGHLLLEIEELGKRSLREAADDHNATLEEVCKKALMTLRGGPSAPKAFAKFKIGKAKTPAYKIGYNVQPQGVAGNVSDPVTVLLFDVNRHLITLTWVRWGLKDLFADLILGFQFAATPVPPAVSHYKLFDMTDGVSKFITFDAPPGFDRAYRSERASGDACWERRDPEGRILSLLTFSNSSLDGKEFAAYVADRVQRYKDHYDPVSDPREVALGARVGTLLVFTDATKEETPETRHVRKVFAKLHREVWEWTIETRGDETGAVAADEKTLEQILASVVMWRSKVK